MTYNLCNWKCVCTAGIFALLLAVIPVRIAFSQTAAVTQQITDPGVSPGAPGAGGPVSGLTPGQLAMFKATSINFQEVDDVPDGLGPRFNLDSCSGCHAFPAVG